MMVDDDEEEESFDSLNIFPGILCCLVFIGRYTVYEGSSCVSGLLCLQNSSTKS